MLKEQIVYRPKRLHGRKQWKEDHAKKISEIKNNLIALDYNDFL